MYVILYANRYVFVSFECHILKLKVYVHVIFNDRKLLVELATINSVLVHSEFIELHRATSLDASHLPHVTLSVLYFT